MIKRSCAAKFEEKPIIIKAIMKKTKAFDDLEGNMGLPQRKETGANDCFTLPPKRKKIQIFHRLKDKKIKRSRNCMLPPRGKLAMLDTEAALHEYQEDINDFMQG